MRCITHDHYNLIQIYCKILKNIIVLILLFIEQPVPVRDGDVRGAGGREAGVQPALVHAAAAEDKRGRSDG